MEKIKNIQIKKTKFNEDIEWSEPKSVKVKLLQISDWILLEDSNIKNMSDWLNWRQQLKECKKDQFDNPADMLNFLNKLESNMPEKKYIDYNFNNIDYVRSKLLKLVRFYYNEKINLEINTYFYDKDLLNERYIEAENFKKDKVKNLQNYPLVNSYCEIHGQSPEDVVSFFINCKKQYYIYLYRNQKEMEEKIKIVNSTPNIELLRKLIGEYKRWILTLTYQNL